MAIGTVQGCTWIFGVMDGGNNMTETKKRTVVRMLTYRVTAWLFTILWTYLFTGNLGEATGFATLLHILLSVDYYIHERIWLKIKWGRQ